MSEPTGEPAGGSRCIACPHDGDRLSIEEIEIALRDQQRRGVFEFSKHSRIESLPQRQPLRAELLDPRDFALGLFAGAQRRRFTAAATGQVRNGLERGRSSAEAPDQMTESDWPNAWRTQQS